VSSPELLRFFYAEAREYLDAVEDLVLGEAPFEAGAFVAASRALRGSATMARVPRVAEIALVMERIANSVRDGEISLSSGLRRDLSDTIIDLRRFVASSSNWTNDDDRQAADRLASLRVVLPPGKTTPPAPPTAGTTPIFIALQASAIATDVESFLANPLNHGLVGDIVTRLRSLRGIAGVADHPPMGEVADSVERTLRERAPDALLRDADIELLKSAAAVFRRASSELRTRGRFESTAAEVDRFARAAAMVASPPPMTPDAPIVRIEELFYTDEGPHLVRRGGTPSRSAEARFREEVITRAEHLRRLVAEARVATDAFSGERLRRDLKAHLGRLDEFARSYGAQQVASVVSEAASLASFGDADLDAIESVARILTTPGIALDEMERRMAIGERKRWTPISTPIAAVAPTARQADVSRTDAARTGRALRDLLHQGISQLSSLEDIPLIEPEPTNDDAIVPVEALVYRGQAALDRARALRDELRSRGTTDPEALHELYELLDLARAE